MQFTVNQLADTMGIEYAQAAALCKIGVLQGSIKEAGQQRQPSGKGKPSTIYSIEHPFILQLDLSKQLNK